MLTKIFFNSWCMYTCAREVSCHQMFWPWCIKAK